MMCVDRPYMMERKKIAIGVSIAVVVAIIIGVIIGIVICKKKGVACFKNPEEQSVPEGSEVAGMNHQIYLNQNSNAVHQQPVDMDRNMAEMRQVKADYA